MYDGINFMKYDTGKLKMNNKLLLSACLICVFGMAGCVRHNYAYTPQCVGPDCPTEMFVEETVVVPEDDYVCQNTDDPTLCPTDPFVNYTGTAADFRTYGERNPRDRLISQAAAGNNLSASIPPSIEDEVIAYEEQIGETQAPGETAQEDISITEDITIEEDFTDDGSQEADENAEDVEDPVQDWLAEEGQNLKALLTEWSEKSGWRLVWNTNRNYVLSAGAMFRGRFADVASALIRAFARARPAPIATFYKGNRVLVVETMEDENAYE